MSWDFRWLSIDYLLSIESGHVDVIVKNSTSRYSLILHEIDDEPRNTFDNVPLSTINQSFYITIQIQ